MPQGTYTPPNGPDAGFHKKPIFRRVFDESLAPEDLAAATDHFSPEQRLGAGGVGAAGRPKETAGGDVLDWWKASGPFFFFLFLLLLRCSFFLHFFSPPLPFIFLGSLTTWVEQKLPSFCRGCMSLVFSE